VAYLRFASVYQAFNSLDDFESAISQLRVEHSDADGETAPSVG
jgi:transcriptional repressor NrdR